MQLPRCPLSVRVRSGEQVRSLTAQVARARDPAGTTAMWVKDRLNGLWGDADFLDWYPRDAPVTQPLSWARSACCSSCSIPPTGRQPRRCVAASISSTPWLWNCHLPQGQVSRGWHGPYPTSSPTAAPLIVARFTTFKRRGCRDLIEPDCPICAGEGLATSGSFESRNRATTSDRSLCIIDSVATDIDHIYLQPRMRRPLRLADVQRARPHNDEAWASRSCSVSVHVSRICIQDGDLAAPIGHCRPADLGFQVAAARLPVRGAVDTRIGGPARSRARSRVGADALNVVFARETTRTCSPRQGRICFISHDPAAALGHSIGGTAATMRHVRYRGWMRLHSTDKDLVVVPGGAALSRYADPSALRAVDHLVVGNGLVLRHRR